MTENQVPDFADGAGLLDDTVLPPARPASMRVVVAGAGVVGRSIARELLASGHQVTLIDKRRSVYEADPVDGVHVSEMPADVATGDGGH